MTPFLKAPFTNEEATDFINSVVRGTNPAPRKPHSCFFYFRFYCFSNSIN